MPLSTLALAALLGSACSSPTTPTPPPPPPDPLSVTCPAPVSQASLSGQPITVHYGSATSTGGTPPVQIACTPTNDSTFPIGSTTVTCTGVDTKGVSASCSFGVTVSAPPRTTLTNFLAFGDSITAGEITVQGEGGIRTLTVHDELSYPTDLRTSLASRYTAQTILVDNAGAKGELTKDGLPRLSATITARHQALLLMEGANDLSNQVAASVRDATLANIQAMVRLARFRGLRVFLATLPPEDPLACCPRRGVGNVLLPSYNSGLQTIAVSEGATLVDVFAAFHNDLTLLGPDGLHPTANGYQVIAGAFFDAIKGTLEAPPATTLTPAFRKPSIVVVPKR